MGADLDINLKVIGDQVVIGALRKVGETAMDALGGAFKMVSDFAVESFKGALEAQAGIDKFNAALKRAGASAPITAAGADELAQKFKNLVGGSDDTILAMETVGLRFDKISKATFPQFIQSSADLAATLKMGPEQAAQLLGKTLQDLSTDGTASLGRLKAAGVQLTDAQEKQIKAMVDAGDAAGAQKVLLDALAATTGGAAAANANTLAGQWTIFQETIADAGEGVAVKLLPPLTALATNILPPLTDAITGTASAVGYFVEALIGGQGLDAALGGLYDFPWEDIFGPQIGAMVYDLIDAFKGLVSGSAGIQEAVINLVATFQASWPMIQAAVADALAYIQGLIGTIMPQIMTNVADTLAQLTAFWQAHGDQIMAFIDIAFKVIAATIGTTLTLITGLIDVALQLINGDWSGAWTTVQNTLTTVMGGILAIVGTNLDSFLNTWRTVLSQLFVIVQEGLRRATQAARDLIEGFKQVGLDIMRGLSDGLNEGIGWVRDAAISAVQGAIDAAKHVLGIHSPSTVFADIGQNMMLGMGQGISANAYQPAQAVAAASYNSTMSVTMNINGAGNPQAVAAAVDARLAQLGRQTDTRMRTQ